jgi:hypothetical protein
MCCFHIRIGPPLQKTRLLALVDEQLLASRYISAPGLAVSTHSFYCDCGCGRSREAGTGVSNSVDLDLVVMEVESRAVEEIELGIMLQQ